VSILVEQIDALHEALSPDNNTGLLRFNYDTYDYELHGAPIELYTVALNALTPWLTQDTGP
jgi:hypothetical protein